MRNGIAYRLPPLVRRISGTEYSFWATRVAQPANGTPEDFLRRKQESVSRGNSMGICLTDLNMQVKAVEAAWFPTPTASSWKTGANRPNLRAIAKAIPTPTASRRSGLQSHGVNVVTGSLNPLWVEWLMGFPQGWTDLEDSATPSCPKSLNGSAAD